MKKVYYKEEQYFSNPGWWVFLAIIFTFAIAPTVVELTGYYTAESANDNGEDAMKLIVLLIVLVLFFILAVIIFKYMKLELEIRNSGIYYRYPPFILKFRSYKKEEIEKFEIRKYKPLKEYSGWGIRYSWGNSGRAFSVKGNVGLQLYLKDGKKVLFGTQRGEALLRAVQKMSRED